MKKELTNKAADLKVLSKEELIKKMIQKADSKSVRCMVMCVSCVSN